MEHFNTALLDALIDDVNKSGFHTETRQALQTNIDATTEALENAMEKDQEKSNFVRQLQFRADILLAEQAELKLAEDDTLSCVIAGTGNPRTLPGRFHHHKQKQALLDQSLLTLTAVFLPRADVEYKQTTAVVKRQTCELVRANTKLVIFDHLAPNSDSRVDDSALQGAVAAVVALDCAAIQAEQEAERAETFRIITLETLRRAGLSV